MDNGQVSVDQILSISKPLLLSSLRGFRNLQQMDKKKGGDVKKRLSITHVTLTL